MFCWSPVELFRREVAREIAGASIGRIQFVDHKCRPGWQNGIGAHRHDSAYTCRRQRPESRKAGERSVFIMTTDPIRAASTLIASLRDVIKVVVVKVELVVAAVVARVRVKHGATV